MLVLLFALLGAATTVAVAWGFALRGVDVDRRRDATNSTPLALPDLSRQEAYIFWPRVSAPGWSWTQTYLMPLESLSPDGRFVNGIGITDSGKWTLERGNVIPTDRQLPLSEAGNQYIELRFGWPFRTMWAIHRREMLFDFGNSFGWSPVLYIRRDRSRSGMPFILYDDRQRSPWDTAVPLGILPRGFALNTAFYAGLWWTLALGIARGRAWNRRRRGLCARCAYSRAGLDAITPCPECGKPAPRRKAQHA